jgi:hypothetical protein
MHGITKEIWHVARSSMGFTGPNHRPEEPGRLRQASRGHQGAAWHGAARAVDILAGASAGGINAIFLARRHLPRHSFGAAHELWLEAADVDTLLDPEVSRVSRFAKAAPSPSPGPCPPNAAARWSGRWSPGIGRKFGPAFQLCPRSLVRTAIFGPGFTTMLLDALDAMRSNGQGTAPAPRIISPGPLRHSDGLPRYPNACDELTRRS